MDKEEFNNKQINELKESVRELRNEINVFKCSVMRVLIQFIGGSFVLFVSVILFLIDKIMKGS